MRPLDRTAPLLALALLLSPGLAEAQVNVRIELGLPAAPQLVVVQPGVQVVADHDDEVFFTDGRYWLRRGDAWYRAPRAQAAFVHVEARLVPAVLVTLTPGRYRRWQPVQAEPVLAPPPPPPTRARPPPPPPPPARVQVLRVKEIKAGRVNARVIHAKEVKARDGRVGRIVEHRGQEGWGRGRAKIEAPEVSADIIYAKEIETDWLDAGEVHAKEVKIGR